TSPAYLKHDGLELGIFGGPDGWCYAFSPKPKQDEDGYDVLQEVWRADCNLPEYRVHRDRPARYASRGGPSEIISTPVTYKNRVYVTIGQDPEHGEGVGNLVCLDGSKTGDITQSGKVWNYSKINRSLSTPSVIDDLVYTADFSGFVYCLDANTGELYWKHDTKGHIWGSTLVADGKVYVGNEDGYLTILQASKELKMLGEIDMMAPIYSSPIAANGVLYVASMTHLFAIAQTAPATVESATE
ncbi:MAG: outer membrane protein assembly factor BamB family protein, partial [Planctomycetota bacterium]